MPPARPGRSRGASGFTLLEILVVVVLLGLILVILAEGGRVGFASLRVEQRLSAGAEGELTTGRLLRGLIGRMDPGDPLGTAYPVTGTPTTLAFATVLPAVPPGLRIAEANVALLVRDHRLLLRWTPLYPAPIAAVVPATERLLDHVGSVDFSYWQPGATGGAWRGTWSGAGLPPMVRIRLKRDDGTRMMPDIVAAPFREAAPT